MLQTALNFWDFRIFEIRLIFCFKQADIFLIFFPFFFPPKAEKRQHPGKILTKGLRVLVVYGLGRVFRLCRILISTISTYRYQLSSRQCKAYLVVWWPSNYLLYSR